jgi:predicted membrane GTPase involved in stress response
MMERDFYLGRILTGRVRSGVVRVGDKVHGLRSTDDGVQKIEDGKVGENFVEFFLLISDQIIFSFVCVNYQLKASLTFNHIK